MEEEKEIKKNKVNPLIYWGYGTALLLLMVFIVLKWTKVIKTIIPIVIILVVTLFFAIFQIYLYINKDKDKGEESILITGHIDKNSEEDCRKFIIDKFKDKGWEVDIHNPLMEGILPEGKEGKLINIYRFMGFDKYSNDKILGACAVDNKFINTLARNPSKEEVKLCLGKLAGIKNTERTITRTVKNASTGFESTEVIREPTQLIENSNNTKQELLGGNENE